MKRKKENQTDKENGKQKKHVVIALCDEGFQRQKNILACSLSPPLSLCVCVSITRMHGAQPYHTFDKRK